MRSNLASAVLIASNISSLANAAELINGNWYGSAVGAITYTNWGLPGTYNRITDMSNERCQSAPTLYQGGMSPLDSEVSWHFRGPMHLKQFAFYSPGSRHPKRDMKPSPHQRRHARFHEKNSRTVHRNEERAVGDWVTATIYGQVVSWINTYSGQPTSAPISPSVVSSITTQVGGTTSSSPSSTKMSSSPVNAGPGLWGRQAYYNAEQGQADGLVFLNNHGGAGSGVFDYHWGMSLSYASAEGTTGSASPQVLKDTLLTDDNEIAIFTDNQCSDDSCGTVRPGTVAYHGFDGASKLFLLEFSMPLSGKTGFNGDMPAAWILNAQIPRTMQYGPAECSCWTSGCGEWDIFEVLDSGNTRCKSTFHGVRSGGDSDYFDRPTNKTVKVAVIFDGNKSAGHIIVLPDKTDFGLTIPNSTVTILKNFAGASGGSVAKKPTIFRLPN